MTILAPFHPAVRKWFAAHLGEPTAPQRDGWPPIREGKNTLIAAPTGPTGLRVGVDPQPAETGNEDYSGEITIRSGS